MKAGILGGLVALAILLAPTALAQDGPLTPPKAAGPCTAELGGSVWQGRVNWTKSDDPEAYDWWLHFRGDGVLVYSYRGQQYDNGRWRQDNAAVTFHMNNHFVDYAGTMSRDAMSGTMINIRGSQGDWRVTRSCSGHASG